MNDDQTQPEPLDDPAFARLQAADPARGAAADLTRVIATVAKATGVPLQGGVPGTTPDTVETIPVDELAARRARRAPRWLQAAAVVAGFAVVAGGGYALGTGHSEPTPAAAPAISLGGAVSGAASGAGSGPGSAAVAGSGTLAPESDAAVSDSKLAAWGFGRTVFTADGLSGEAGTGTAWALDAASVFSQETAARVAAALGVTGTPVLQYGSWSVGSTDGTGPSVTLSPDGMASVSYYDPARDPWTCVRSAPDSIEKPATGSDATGSGGSAMSVPESTSGTATDSGQCATPASPAPTGDAALAQAKATLTALGVDPATYEFEVSEVASDPTSAQLSTVTAYQVVGGQRSGVSWNLQLVASGVQSLYGTLAPLVELGAYDVVSPTDAVARLGDPRFGPSYGGVMPLAAGAMVKGDAGSGVASSAAAPSADPTVPATPAAGSPIGWPVQHVTIVSSRLGLALTTLPSGAAVLVPTYELTDADGSTWTVIAVADSELDLSAAG